MDIKIIDIIATILINFICCAYTENILSCNITQWASCPGKYEMCEETTNKCICIDGYAWNGDECVAEADYSSNHDTTAAVVSIFTIALVATGLVLVIRKYNLIDYIRRKLKRNNDVMYEDVMIGQDDPPLVP